MKTRKWKIEAGDWPVRSVLECGGPPPLFPATDLLRPAKSARGLAQSKTWRIFDALLAAFALTGSVHAQSYSIDWYKIAGGGGTSTGATYQVIGTIGQPDASGAMSGGNYSLTGGFWSLISVVQTAAAPNLVIAQSGNSVIVSWPNTGNYSLLQNADLALVSGWVPTIYQINTANGTNSITITSPTGYLFFRLSNP
jgi:hypothetical protein